jgi:hypothetical protein
MKTNRELPTPARRKRARGSSQTRLLLAALRLWELKNRQRRKA